MTKRTALLCRLLLTSSAVTVAVAALAGAAIAAPKGGKVAGGTATIASAPGTTVINQTSARAIINWAAFDVGATESVRFNQPDAGSVTLNRVLSTDPSHIDGSITANGRIFIVNPNGVLFGAGARIQVGGLVATSADIEDSDFMAGHYSFNLPSSNPSARIENDGTISIADTGLAALVAPNVVNRGTITARLGAVTLGGHSTFTLDLAGDGLIAFDTGAAAPVSGAVSNDGTVIADGGSVRLDAGAASGVVGGVIDMSGVIQARSIGTHEGRIVLSGAAITVSGSLDASASPALADDGTTASQAGGFIRARGGALDRPLELSPDAEAVPAMAGASPSPADANGGTILIGGDRGGAGPDRNAATTTIAAGAIIRADGSGTGSGGTIVAWADGSTRFDGTISARGGADGGAGGFVETSGHDSLSVTTGRVDASGPGGAGTWLMDPTDITIGTATSGGTFSGGTFTPDAGANTATVDAAAISAALNGGSNVTIATASTGGGSGDITVASAINYGGASAQVLTLQADRNILVNAAITGAKLGLFLNAAGNINVAAPIEAKIGSGFTAGGTLTLGPTAAILLDPGTTTNITSTFTGTTGFTQQSGATISVAAGDNLTIAGNPIVLQGAAGSISGQGTGARQVTLSTNGTIGLGTGAGATQLSQAALNTIANFVGAPNSFGSNVTPGTVITAGGDVDIAGTVSLPRIAQINAVNLTLEPSAALTVHQKNFLENVATLDATGTFTQSAGATITATGDDPNFPGGMLIFANHIALNGAAGSITAGQVQLVPFFANETVGIGTAPGDFQLSQSELDTIGGPKAIGANNVNLTVAGGVNLAGASLIGNDIVINDAVNSGLGAHATHDLTLASTAAIHGGGTLFAGGTFTQQNGATITTTGDVQLQIQFGLIALNGAPGSISFDGANNSAGFVNLGPLGPLWIGSGTPPAGTAQLTQAALNVFGGVYELDISQFGLTPQPLTFAGDLSFTHTFMANASDITLRSDAHITVDIPFVNRPVLTTIAPYNDEPLLFAQFALTGTGLLTQQLGATIHAVHGSVGLSGFTLDLEGAPGSISGGPESGSASLGLSGIDETENLHPQTLAIGTATGDVHISQAVLDEFTGFAGVDEPPELQTGLYDPRHFAPFQIDSFFGSIAIGGPINLSMATAIGRTAQTITLAADTVLTGPSTSFAGPSLQLIANTITQAAGGRIVAPSVEFEQDDFFGFATATGTFTLNGTTKSDNVTLLMGVGVPTSTGTPSAVTATAADIEAGTLTIQGTTGSAALQGTVNNTSGQAAAQFVKVPGGLNPAFTFNGCEAGTVCGVPPAPPPPAPPPPAPPPPAPPPPAPPPPAPPPPAPPPPAPPPPAPPPPAPPPPAPPPPAPPPPAPPPPAPPPPAPPPPAPPPPAPPPPAPPPPAPPPPAPPPPAPPPPSPPPPPAVSLSGIPIPPTGVEGRDRDAGRGASVDDTQPRGFVILCERPDDPRCGPPPDESGGTANPRSP